MLILPIEEARTGVTLAMGVFHPAQPDQQLLKAGFVLTQPVIDRLVELGVQSLYIDYPGLNDLDKYLMPVLSPARQQVFQQMKKTIAAVEKTAQPTVTFPDYYMATRELVLTLMQNGTQSVYLDEMSARMPSDEVHHATAVAHLSLMLGLKLEQYLISQRARLSPQHAREVVNLGVAGMLHDLGKVRLPPEIRRNNGVTPPEEEARRGEWEAHAQLGYDMLRNGIEPSGAAAVLHHHQHFDGTGFPPLTIRDDEGKEALVRPTGQKIHVFARIVAAANLYDRLTLGSNGARRPNVEILHLMRTTYRSWLDPEVLKAVVAVVPPFPPGSRVVLSDNTTAVVVELRAGDPYRPSVRRVGPDGWTLIGEKIDLATSRELGITSAGGVSVGEMIPAAPDSKGVKPAA